MVEYISKDKFIHFLFKEIAYFEETQTDIEIPISATLQSVVNEIKKFTSEDVQPVEYGEWTAEGNDEYGNYWDECTVCRKAVFFPPSVKNDYKYCPHCGARMDGDTNG